MSDKERIDGEVYDEEIAKIFVNKHEQSMPKIETLISKELLKFYLNNIGKKFGKEILEQLKHFSTEKEVHSKLQGIINNEDDISKKNKFSENYSILLGDLTNYNFLLRDFLSSPLKRNNKRFTNLEIGRSARIFLKRNNYLKTRKNPGDYYPTTLKISEIKRNLNLNDAIRRTLSKKELENSLSRLVTKGVLKKLDGINGYYQYVSEEREVGNLTSLNEEYQIKNLKSYLKKFSKKEDYNEVLSAWNMTFLGIGKEELESMGPKVQEEFFKIAWRLADNSCALNNLINKAKKEKGPKNIRIFIG